HVERAEERTDGAGMDRDVGSSRELEDLQCVRRRLVDRLVARDRGDADELELGRRERQQNRDRVVVAWIAVEDDRGRSHASSIAATSSAAGSEGCAPAREAAIAPAATTASGTSSWQRTAPPGETGRTSAFAPATTTIWFSPSAATRMSAIPVLATRVTSSSTPASRSPASASSASESSPTAPTIR